MRDVLTRLGGIDLCVTEFVRVTNVLLPTRAFHRLAPELLNGGKTRAGTTVRVQLLVLIRFAWLKMRPRWPAWARRVSI
jgi:tRNA-dihydrouridine synthase C